MFWKHILKEFTINVINKVEYPESKTIEVCIIYIIVDRYKTKKMISEILNKCGCQKQNSMKLFEYA